jgi:hypothetical protein
MIDLGTQYKLSTECGLVGGNLQPPGTVSLFRKPKISWLIFLVSLKVQYTHYDKQRPALIFTKFLSVKIVDYKS